MMYLTVRLHRKLVKIYWLNIFWKLYFTVKRNIISALWTYIFVICYLIFYYQNILFWFEKLFPVTLSNNKNVLYVNWRFDHSYFHQFSSWLNKEVKKHLLKNMWIPCLFEKLLDLPICSLCLYNVITLLRQFVSMYSSSSSFDKENTMSIFLKM